jgi:hypothetical protein
MDFDHVAQLFKNSTQWNLFLDVRVGNQVKISW